jgi:hypothetical protein
MQTGVAETFSLALEWNPYIIEVILHAATEVTIFYEEAR